MNSKNYWSDVEVWHKLNDDTKAQLVGKVPIRIGETEDSPRVRLRIKELCEYERKMGTKDCE